MGGEGGKRAFVTVGTTKFDALIKAMDSLAVADELAVQGFSDLIMQVLPLTIITHRRSCGRRRAVPPFIMQFTGSCLT